MASWFTGVSKLKEGATSFTNIAKNMLFIENPDDDDDEEGEHIENHSDQNTFPISEKDEDAEYFNSQGTPTHQTTKLSKKSHSHENGKDTNNHHTKNSSSKDYLQNFEAEEFEQRIKGFQNILRDNEKTIEKFKQRVLELEKQVQEHNDGIHQNRNIIDQTLEEQVGILLNALNQERSNSSEKDRAIHALETEYNVVILTNHKLKSEYFYKVKEIETILGNLSVASNDKDIKLMFQKIQSQLNIIDPDIIKYQQIIHNMQTSNTLISDISIMIEGKIETLHKCYQEKLDLQEKQLIEERDRKLREFRQKYEELQAQNQQQQKKKADVGELVNVLNKYLTFTFNIDNSDLSKEDSVEQLVEKFSKLVQLRNESISKSYSDDIRIMKELIYQNEEKFKSLSLMKYRQQVQKNIQQITNRFQSSFKDTSIFNLTTQQITLQNELHSLITELQSQVTEVTAKKDTLNQQFTKLQKECREMAQKEKETNKLKEQLDTKTSENSQIQQQIQEVLNDKIGFKVKLEEQREKLELTVVENASLKEKIGQTEDEIIKLKHQIKQQSQQLEQQEHYKEQLEKSHQEYKFLEVQLKSKEGELDEQKRTVNKLQRAVEQSQEESDQMLRLKEREQKEDKLLIQQLQMQVDAMKDKIRESASLEDKLMALDSEFTIAKQQLERSEIEQKEVKKYASDLLDKVQKDKESMEFMVDRRVINKFLINYANPQSTLQVKQQMLEAMSGILAFTMEEKQTLGLAKKQNLPSVNEQNQDKKGIGDRLINFFLADDDD